MSFGIWQILLIVLVVLLIFGANKIPRLMGDMAKGIKSFKAGMKEGETENTAQASQPQQPAQNAQDDAKAIDAETKAADASSVKKDEVAKS
ncbi:MAG: twin-arginine translocase TatA/TatE family subunit [Rhodospirillaceae bacterium]|nr:twin-arginine translocase TatA/TatE family subunit [Rhodospirillaceae bacterium]|tara:strand:+ start:3382 stop:3654 length:273 start_codon:yes stop_codon:yes gene_type:complete